MRKFKKYSASKHAIIAWMIAVCCVQPGMAGTQGSYMNSSGVGKAVDSVAFGGIVSQAISSYGQNPCARVNGGEAPAFSCINETKLPATFPGKAYCQSQGLANYRWTIQANAVGGATCDNPELEDLLNIIPANCAKLEVTTSAVLTDAYSGHITVDAFATDGAGIRVRGIESLTPPANLEDLKANGLLRFDFSLSGPFDLDTTDCTALTIPFKTQSGHANLYFVVDTVALSIPFEIACPEDVVFQCGDTLEYPAVSVVSGGCGPFSVIYDPPAESLPIGESTLVTATVIDGDPLDPNNTATCTFMATRNSIVFDGFYSPINSPAITYNGGDCPPAVYSISRGRTLPVKFRTTFVGCESYSGIAPTFRFESCSQQPKVTVPVGNLKLVAGEWHGNVDTSLLKNTQKGDYLLIVTLQDGSQKAVTIKVN